MTNQVNQEAFEKWAMKYYGETVMSVNPPQHYLRPNEYMLDTYRNAYEGWQARESEINSLKQRVEELEAENTIMRDALNKIALGYVYDADIIESAGDCLQRLSTTKSLAEHDNATIEQIATALENADGELKYLPEYVALVRGMKATP